MENIITEKQCSCGAFFKTRSKTRNICAKCGALSRAKYKQNHPEECLQIAANWRERKRTQIREKHRRWSLELKKKAFSLFGSICQRCEFDDIRALQVDHKNGARGMRKNKNRSGAALYAALLNGTMKIEDFQLLCANCNWIKRFEKKEHCLQLS